MIEAPRRVAPELFVTRWIDINLPADAAAPQDSSQGAACSCSERDFHTQGRSALGHSLQAGQAGCPAE
jgi:hypothetical protein